MNVLLVSLGSAGDVHPFLALGLALRARGHAATLMTGPAFESLARAVGLEFVALPMPDKKERAPEGLAGLALRSCAARWRRLARASTILPQLRPVYDRIARHHVPGRTVVLASSSALGARVAHDRLGVPLVTVHLAPLPLRSAYQPPAQPPLVLPRWAPRWARRAAYWLLDALVLDRVLAPALNAFRGELGLPPVRRALAGWRHSPQLVLGLFPPWFAPPQPDWPPQARAVGFALYDEAERAGLPAPVRNFLERGAAPVVFTPSSAVRENRRFFEEGVKACHLLGRRALLLTRFRDQVPAGLPPQALHADYVPFSLVLPRAAALVHYGGIGSAAQALKAGIPQVVVPLKNDQWDNGARLQRLGVARVVPRRGACAAALGRALQDLLHSAQVAGRCRDLAQRVAGADVLGEACRLIEETAR
jgi:UDP:flavonoid glycosyltransferase YjiC (YdhE family)